MAKFEKVKRFEDADIQMPSRATANSAGYDLYVAEDKVIQPLLSLNWAVNEIANKVNHDEIPTLDLGEAANVIKGLAMKPALVSTGVKCKLDPGTYLELSVRSSTPLKYLLILANGVGIVDADYYGNPGNPSVLYSNTDPAEDIWRPTLIRTA